MKTTMTEGQKRLLTILFTAVLCIIVARLCIQPMNKTIKENEVKLEKEEKKAQDMRRMIQDTTLETTYAKLKTESQITFNKNYRSFKANEKIEEILNQYNVELTSLNIGEYRELDSNSYTMNVVQPKDEKSYREMYAIMQSPKMKLFLVSEISIEGEATYDQFMQVLNAINNIAPEGPGEAEMARYCMQIPTVEVDRESDQINILINMYGMKPPPVDAAEIED